MDFDHQITSIPQKPDGLDVILAKFKKSEPDWLEWVMAALAEYENGLTPDDGNIINVLCTYKPGEETAAYWHAYVHYMGLAFYYQNALNTEFAWHYYAKAQHYLGVLDGWERLLDHLCREDIERQQKAKAAKKKSEKNNKDLTDAFLKAIYEKKPPEGWASTKELIDATLPEVEETHIRNTDRIYPLYENLEDAMRRWLKNHREIYQAYDETASPNNKDVL